MKKLFYQKAVRLFFCSLMFWGCNSSDSSPAAADIAAINLKRGAVINCGPTDQQLGTVEFTVSANKNVQEDFNLAIKFLHSFEYDEAEKVFAKIIDQQPTCAMAYWGVAMSNFHPLWTPPLPAELQKGSKAIAIAQAISSKTKKETGYINAINLFYKDADKTDHRSRCIKFEQAMNQLQQQYPDDKEAAIFYALALTAAADPADKTFTKQKKAGAILNALYPGQPNHPGIIHYIIHTYDYPELAGLALPAARKYAAVAPSSAHAMHMPSHIFTRLGLWSECINANLASVNAAKCYAEAAGIKGHWDEELHGMDYLVYGYLQRGDNDAAKKQWDYLKTITVTQPLNFKVAYAYAAIPSRYVLENKLWKEAAALKIHTDNIDWEKFQWQEAILHFTRALGAVHTANLQAAKTELQTLKDLHQKLLQQKDDYKANQVNIQITTAAAWINFKEGNNDEAVNLMQTAAAMEDKTEKHPVTPGEVIPARELLADMLLQMDKPAAALKAYEEDLKKHPNRFNALYGAGLAAEKINDMDKAKQYYTQLTLVTGEFIANRREIQNARLFLKNKFY